VQDRNNIVVTPPRTERVPRPLSPVQLPDSPREHIIVYNNGARPKRNTRLPVRFADYDMTGK